MIAVMWLFVLLHMASAKPLPAHVAVASASPLFSQETDSGVYDSADTSKIPRNVPQAVYANGRYAAPASVARGHPRTLWIDVTGHDPKADVLDIEQYDATPAQAGPWAEAAYRDHPGKPVIIYTNVSNWHRSEISVAEYAPNVVVRWWIASPQFRVPHMAPGACATQWLWTPGYNISETLPCFWVPGN